MSNWKHVLSALSFATMFATGFSPMAMAKTVSPSIGKIRQPSHAQTTKSRATPKAEVSPAQPREPKEQVAPRKKSHRTVRGANKARTAKTKSRGKRMKTARVARKGRSKVGATSAMGHRAKKRVARRA